MLAVEIVARARGYSPFQPAELDLREPTMVQPDPALGWIPKPGDYVSPPYEPGGSSIHYHFLEDHSRATSENLSVSNYDLIFLGCSFTLGWALSDQETYAWKLQSKFPSLRMGNFGAGGYGTYQSLLMLRKLFNQGMKPAVILYGFNPFHEERNAASAHWLRELAALTKRKHFAMPYCSLDKNRQIAEHSTVQWPTFPLQEHFAFPQMLIEIYYKLSTNEKSGELNKREITKKLLLEMRDLAEQNNAKLVVVILTGEGEDFKFYSDFLRSHEVDMADVTFPMGEEHHMPVDGHPNGISNSLWADKIAEYLKAYAPFRETLSHKA